MPTTATGRSSATTFLSRLRDPYALPTRFALVLACPSLASAQTGAPSDVSIYVFTKTDPSGFSDPFQAQRLESLETVKVTLKKRKGITVVEQADQADVHIEIINAGKLETGAQRTKGLSTGLDGAIFGTRTTKETKPQVHVVLRASDYQLGIHGTAPRMKYAAAAVGDGVEKWVKRNRKLLAERRTEKH